MLVASRSSARSNSASKLGPYKDKPASSSGPLPLAMNKSGSPLRNCAVEVVRLDPKPLTLRPTDPKRVEVNSRHFSVDSFCLETRFECMSPDKNDVQLNESG